MINNYTAQQASAMAVPILLFVVGVACMILAALYKNWADKKRRDAVRDWAGKNRFEFREGPEHGMPSRFPGLDFLNEGFDRQARFVDEGRREFGGICSFDWHYKTKVRTKNGTRTRHHAFTVVAVETDVPMEPMVIRPEGLVDKINAFFGHDDIDFESAEFSRAFHVSCPNRRWAYDLLHPAAIQHLLDSPRLRIDFGTSHAATRAVDLMEVWEIERALRIVGGLLRLMPRHVVQERMAALRDAPLPPKEPRLSGVGGMVQSLGERFQANARGRR